MSKLDRLRLDALGLVGAGGLVGLVLGYAWREDVGWSVAASLWLAGAFMLGRVEGAIREANRATTAPRP